MGDDLRDVFAADVTVPLVEGQCEWIVERTLPSRRLACRVLEEESARVLEIRLRASSPALHRRDVVDDAVEMLNRLPIGVLLQGPKAEIILANQAAFDLLGVTEAQLLGSTSFDPDWKCLKPDGLPYPGDEHPVPTVLKTREPVRDAIMLVYRPPTHDWVRLSVDALPRLDAAGEVIDVVCSFRDVTAHHEMLESNAREHRLFEQVMETSITGLAVLEPSGTIVFANAAAERVLGLSRSEIEGRSYNAPGWRSTTPDGQPWTDEMEPFRRVMDTRAPVSDIRQAIHLPTGERRVLSIDGAPVLDDAGAVSRLVFSVSDITAAEDERARRESLEAKLFELSRVEALSVMAAGIAHDFNNLLSGVLGAASLAHASLGDDAQVGEHLATLEQAALRASDLTRQLLAYSGRGQFVVEAEDVATLVRESAPLLRALVRGMADVAIAPSAALPATRLDRTQFGQALMNLVVNAAQSMDHPAAVVDVHVGHERIERERLEAAAIAAEGAAPGEFVIVAVRDRGPGIDAAIVPRIFDPFFSTRDGGRGLGLAAVAGVARGHDGFVEVHSTPNGSSFRVGFPVSAEARRANESRSPVAERAGPGLAAVCDDEELVRSLCVRMLEAAGWSVRSFASGEALLRWVRDEGGAPDVLVVDFTMPGMDGAEVLSAVREAGCSAPAVVMSGYASGVPVRDATFLPKPFRVRDLTSALAEALA